MHESGRWSGHHDYRYHHHQPHFRRGFGFGPGLLLAVILLVLLKGFWAFLLIPLAFFALMFLMAARGCGQEPRYYNEEKPKRKNDDVYVVDEYGDKIEII